jgi:hypothetical protein
MPAPDNTESNQNALLFEKLLSVTPGFAPAEIFFIIQALPGQGKLYFIFRRLKTPQCF